MKDQTFQLLRRYCSRPTAEVPARPPCLNHRLGRKPPHLGCPVERAGHRASQRPLCWPGRRRALPLPPSTRAGRDRRRSVRAASATLVSPAGSWLEGFHCRWDLANAVAHRRSPVCNALLDHVLTRPVICFDQTSWPRREGGPPSPGRCGASPHRAPWCIASATPRATATFVDLVGSYTGTIVCDALATHAAGARAGPGITLAAC